MKKTLIFSLTFIFIASAFTLSDLWRTVNGEKIIVNFKLNQEGTSGTLKGVESTINFDENDLSKSSITSSVSVGTLTTGNKQRDEHLLNEDFFDVEKYPKITFQSSSIEKTNSGFLAKGKLTIKDQTLDMEVPFTFENGKKGKASFKGQMEVSPYKFGIFKGEKRKDETVSIQVEIPLSK
jgi:polyisoprenoid-binding protein YceI